MVMLSQLLRFKLKDENGVQAPLSDLSVDLFEGEHPPVTGLYFNHSTKQKRSLPWSEVRSIDWSMRTVRAANLKAAQKETTESMRKVVLLADGEPVLVRCGGHAGLGDLQERHYSISS